MRAAEIIVSSLKAHGIERVYCVPGESYLTLLDALYGSGIEIIVCRHEGGAGFMAVAEAKLTGKPGVFMVSRGPGATNGSIAIHMAEQDAVPLIMLIGQVSREERTRAVFQEVDYGQFFGGMAKAVFEINDGAKLHELMPRAMRLASEGVPGPVVLALPEDMLRDKVEPIEALVYPAAKVQVSPAEIAMVLELIGQAERPLMIAGGLLRGTSAAEALQRFAAAQRVPVAVTWKNQDVFDNGSELYAGQLNFGTQASQRQILGEADLIIAIGTRLGDVGTLGFTLPQAPQPNQKLIHIYPSSGPIGRVIRADLGIVADPVLMLRGLSQDARVVSAVRERWISQVNGETKKSQIFTSPMPEDGVDFGVVTAALERFADDNALITMDAGNMTSWAHRYWKMTPKNTLVGGIVGAMGFGVPAAVAASLVQPNRQVICLVGDGGVLMTGQELATAMAYGATPKIVISDNGIYGTIRSHQEKHFPARVSGTNLRNPDFTTWAKSFGAETYTLSLGDDVNAVVQNFLSNKLAAVLHVKSSKTALSAGGVLAEIEL
jgi:acetolactate synthase I/II/III large subunit